MQIETFPAGKTNSRKNAYKVGPNAITSLTRAYFYVFALFNWSIIIPLLIINHIFKLNLFSLLLEAFSFRTANEAFLASVVFAPIVIYAIHRSSIRNAFEYFGFSENGMYVYDYRNGKLRETRYIPYSRLSSMSMFSDGSGQFSGVNGKVLFGFTFKPDQTLSLITENLRLFYPDIVIALGRRRSWVRPFLGSAFLASLGIMIAVSAYIAFLNESTSSFIDFFAALPRVLLKFRTFIIGLLLFITLFLIQQLVARRFVNALSRSREPGNSL